MANLRMSLAVVLLHAVLFRPCESLWCNCTVASCEEDGARCETDGACMVSSYVTEGQKQLVRVCIARASLVPPGQPFYCLSAEGLLNTHCCYTDYCNSIDLKMP